MPWKLDYIWGGGPNPPRFGFEDGQHEAVVLRGPGAIPDKEYLPIRIFQDSKHKTLPDYTTGPTTNNLLVSRKFRDLIEAWDAVEHTYLPVTLRRFTGEVSLDQYFVFIPQGHLENGIVVDESDVNEVIIKDQVHGYLPTAQRPRLMWRKSVVGGRHLWTDQHLKNAIVVSDDLFAELEKHGVRGYQAHESRFSEKEL